MRQLNATLSRGSTRLKYMRSLGRNVSNLLNNRLFRAMMLSVIIIFTGLSVLVVDSTNRLQRAIERLNRDLIMMSDKSLSEITLDDIEALDESVEDLVELTERVRIFTFPLRSVSMLTADWRVSVQSIDAIHELGLAAQVILDGIQPVLVFIYSNDGDDITTTDKTSGARISDLLEFGIPDFEVASAYLSEAENQLNSIQLDNVSIESVLNYDVLRNTAKQLTALNNVLLNCSDVLRVMLGIDEETTYLILAQNNDEIRPSGGFIGSYGWFTLHYGRVNDFDYSPSNDKNPNPPRPDRMQPLDIPDWWIQYQNPIYAAWDGSWYVDFPTTAHLAATYYNAGENLSAPVDAVIAIDITGFEIILEALGDVPVSGYDVTVNSSNFREVVYDIRSGGAATDEHKIFLAAVYRAIQTRWSDLPNAELPNLLLALLTGLQEKHILLYYEDTSSQDVVEQMGWGGKQLPSLGYDYLLVADANITGNKSNNSISRSTAYDVELLPDGTVNQRLAIQYDYLDTIAQKDPAVNVYYHGPLVYVNQMQLYTPPTSELISTDNIQSLMTFTESDHLHHVTRLQVNYDTTRRFELNYQTPALIEEMGRFGRYKLLIQKQPGIRNEEVAVRVLLPPDAEFIVSTPEAQAVYDVEQVALDFFISLSNDHEIDVIFELP